MELTIVCSRCSREALEYNRAITAFKETDFRSVNSSFPDRPIPEGEFAGRKKGIGDNTLQFRFKEPMREEEAYPDADLGTPGNPFKRVETFMSQPGLLLSKRSSLGTEPATCGAIGGLSYFEPCLSGLLQIMLSGESTRRCRGSRR